MDRRDALKALSSIAVASGLTVTPVTTLDVQGVELVLIKCPGLVSQETAARIRALWLEGMKGTALEHIRTVVLTDGLEVDFVRTTGGS
jgi:hypothetical protein